MCNITDLIYKKRLYFDGGMGTMLQRLGLKPDQTPEEWNITNPEAIADIYRQYISAGANIITTNTFGANCLKSDNYEKFIKAGVKCAREAVKGQDETFVAFDVGPLGVFLEPIGELKFDDAVEIFAKSIRVAVSEGVDVIHIETMTDSYETKAAVIAAKEVCDLPIFVTNVYDERGTTLTGASPEAMVAMLEGLGVSALGINCSLGPDKMIPLIERIYRATSLPIIANPNAGLPVLDNGFTSYSLNAERFAEYATILARSGANILGGCCGTDPEYIRQTVLKTKSIPINVVEKRNITCVSSYVHAVSIGDKPIIIGERINPTGKPKMKKCLLDSNTNYIVNMAIDQEQRGAHILDVNVGLAGIDEEEMMDRAVSSIQSVCTLPLQLDSNDPKVLERAMRHYNGKPMINSVNGDDESMEKIFPLVKKYGGVVVALTLDKNGIPTTAQGRVDIANRIVEKAKTYGLSVNDLVFDPLTLTVATDPKNAEITLDAVKMLSSMGFNTVLGLSNVSFGMPDRDKINTAFFARALSCGLTCAMMNPSSVPMMSVYHSYDDIVGGSIAIDEIEVDSHTFNLQPSASSDSMSLSDAIVKGLPDIAAEITKKELDGNFPFEIINNDIIPALNIVGIAFDKNEIYLPQLLMSADASSRAFAVLKESAKFSKESGKKIIIATVKGDIHDIGKNIVKLLLESYGFDVIDLGKNVDANTVLEAVKYHKCNIVALSALMTTTLPAMEETVRLLHSYSQDVEVMVGGAVLTQDYADKIGADAYGKDAMAAVSYANKFYTDVN